MQRGQTIQIQAKFAQQLVEQKAQNLTATKWNCNSATEKDRKKPFFPVPLEIQIKYLQLWLQNFALSHSRARELWIWKLETPQNHSHIKQELSLLHSYTSRECHFTYIIQIKTGSWLCPPKLGGIIPITNVFTVILLSATIRISFWEETV